MSNLFSNIKEKIAPTDTKAAMRKNQRELNRANRELERDRTRMDRDEAKLKQDIKKAAKQGDKASVNILAKQVVRTRNQKAKSYQASANISGVGNNMKMMQSQQVMAKSMGNTT